MNALLIAAILWLLADGVFVALLHRRNDQPRQLPNSNVIPFSHATLTNSQVHKDVA